MSMLVSGSASSRNSRSCSGPVSIVTHSTPTPFSSCQSAVMSPPWLAGRDRLMHLVRQDHELLGLVLGLCAAESASRPRRAARPDAGSSWFASLMRRVRRLPPARGSSATSHWSLIVSLICSRWAAIAGPGAAPPRSPARPAPRVGRAASSSARRRRCPRARRPRCDVDRRASGVPERVTATVAAPASRATRAQRSMSLIRPL